MVMVSNQNHNSATLPFTAYEYMLGGLLGQTVMFWA